MKNASLITVLFIFAVLNYSCDRNDKEDCGCPQLQFGIPISPYDDPIWHPNGEIVGFNYIPIKEIHYYAGKECPYQADYYYDQKNEGFYLMDKDGNNIRKVLPFTLGTPSWSPDGTKIAFSNGAQICIINFDGEDFDINSIIAYDFPGNKSFPRWSFDGTKISFIQSICDETPCGVWVYTFETGVLEHIKNAFGHSDWYNNSYRLIFTNRITSKQGLDNTYIYSHDYESGNRDLIYKLSPPNIRINEIKYSSSCNAIAFTSQINTATKQLYVIDPNGGEKKQLTTLGCYSFDWSPDGKQIIYVNFSSWNLDKTVGTIWVMNADGSNKKPLTFNEIVEYYK